MLKPTNEKDNVPSDGTLISYFPLMSVVTDSVEPTTKTFAPGNVSPFSSDMVPETLV